MMETIMKMKSALVGLVLGGLSVMLRNTNSDPGITPIDTIIRKGEQAKHSRNAFNGGLPSVKRAQRLAKAKRATRRARKLGHA
ncbi:hypothetical protein [Aeromonas dhakensis]|uniref:hypothetical protein n=2 Tax=Aeromonas dhakensis TaxID=196024 RepID=UPI00191CEC1D|nr:hypothetical protein [Aeromonas dhakensis]MBL0634188.1 hypothetical protein [Aeromonas dhakensis]